MKETRAQRDIEKYNDLTRSGAENFTLEDLETCEAVSSDRGRQIGAALKVGFMVGYRAAMRDTKAAWRA